MLSVKPPVTVDINHTGEYIIFVSNENEPGDDGKYLLTIFATE